MLFFTCSNLKNNKVIRSESTEVHNEQENCESMITNVTIENQNKQRNGARGYLRFWNLGEDAESTHTSASWRSNLPRRPLLVVWWELGLGRYITIFQLVCYIIITIINYKCIYVFKYESSKKKKQVIVLFCFLRFFGKKMRSSQVY